MHPNRAQRSRAVKSVRRFTLRLWLRTSVTLAVAVLVGIATLILVARSAHAATLEGPVAHWREVATEAISEDDCMFWGRCGHDQEIANALVDGIEHCPSGELAADTIQCAYVRFATERLKAAPGEVPLGERWPLPCIRSHEGTYTTNTGNGYLFAYQWLPSTLANHLRAAGLEQWIPRRLAGLPAHVQDLAAWAGYEAEGFGPWPPSQGGRC